MEDNVKGNKIVENGLVIIVVLVVFAVLTPIVLKIIDSSAKSAAETSTKGVMESVKNMYSTLNLMDPVHLPFKIVFTKDGYSATHSGEKYDLTGKGERYLKGNLPKGGYVEVKAGNIVVAKDLEFGAYKCTQEDNIPHCEKNK